MQFLALTRDNSSYVSTIHNGRATSMPSNDKNERTQQELCVVAGFGRQYCGMRQTVSSVSTVSQQASGRTSTAVALAGLAWIFIDYAEFENQYILDALSN